ncbi:MAG: tetratricopeptide repeat protein, partial [Myxococcales bacterium]|nr:tetratricopeptide repeat protein [Myxococcales bacterium]
AHGQAPEVTGSIDDPCPEAIVTAGIAALAVGALDDVDAALARLPGSAAPLLPEHGSWLAATRALATPAFEGGVDQQPDEALARTIAALRGVIAREPGAVAHRQALAWLLLRAGARGEAVSTLTRLRADAPRHMGLAADEALLNAALLRELGAAADLSDQLLSLGPDQVPAHALARARVARGRVHVHTGEPERGVALLEQAWPELPPWDWPAREQTLDTLLTAGEAARARAHLEGLALPETEAGIYEAWARLVEGDLQDSLERLAALPQAHPAVAYLQALALVEQRRLEEAGPWLTRARRLWPGRVELEVAAARAAVETGDLRQALRTLEGLARDEPFAPRAWTGLGEASLRAAVADDGDDPKLLRQAHDALLTAVEREPIPAEAMLRLSELWQRQRLRDPDGDRKALEWLEKAADASPRAPRYREALALYLTGLGDARRAEALLEALVDARGVSHAVPLTLAELSLNTARERGTSPPEALEGWLARARELGAPAEAIARAEALAALLSGRRRALARALAPIAEAVERDPRDVDARVLQAELLIALREEDAAEKAIRLGLRQGEGAEVGRLYLAWARLELRRGNSRQAAFHARVAWARMRDEQRPTGELADVVELSTRLFVRKDLGPQALAIAREFTRKLPNHAEAWRLRARTELAVGEARDALKAIERAIELDPESARAHVLHAKILLRHGDRKRARAAYQRALERALPEDERADVEKALRR